MVDVAQDLVVSEEDCGTKEGIMMRSIVEGGEVIVPLGDRVLGRTVAENVFGVDKKDVLIKAGTLIDEELVESMSEIGVYEINVRSAIYCETIYGICSKCYGRDLGRGHKSDIGEAVGIVAAQSIGAVSYTHLRAHET